MNRRDFLRPKNLLRPAGQVFGAMDELRAVATEASDTLENDALESDALARDAVLLHFARQAMATTFEIILPFATSHAHEAASAALDRIDALEAQLTVYREDSEVSRLNRLAFQ